MKPLRRLLFATDFSPASGAAWRRAVALAEANRAQLYVVHVLAPLAQAQSVRWAYRELEAEMRSDAQRRLRVLLGRARKRGVRAKALLLTGTPHETIVRAARSNRVDLVVLGTHGRTGLSGALIGSVAARVVATATCPVMTVRSR